MFIAKRKYGRMLRMAGAVCLALAATAATNAETAPAEAPTESAPASNGFVVVCPIEGMVDDGMAILVQRAVREATGASALIFEVDTPGGLVDAAIEISNSILEAPCKTIAYVKGMGAISAGALITYSCDAIILAPATNIGASAPVIMGGAEPSEEFNEKTKSYLRSRYRTLGEEKGHEPLLGEAMVDAKIEVRALRGTDGKYTFYRVEHASDSEAAKATPEVTEILDSAKKALEQGSTEPLRELVEPKTAPAEQLPPSDLPAGTEIVSRAGELLTLSSRQAQQYGLIQTTANSLAEVMGFYNVGGQRIVDIIPTWAERLFRWLTSPTISGLLLMLGIGGLYLEMKTPGFGLPGIVGLTCLGLFFGSYLIIGLADWMDILLVLAGLVLIFIEIFITPGFGLMGFSGIFCLLAGFYLALTRVTIPQYTWDFQRLENAGQTVFVASTLLGVFAVATWKLFPKTPFFRWIVLTSTQQVAQGYVVQAESAQKRIGRQGRSTSMLRPAGRGRFGDETVDVVTRGEFIEPNRPIEIIEASGNRYVVVEVEEKR